MSTRIQWRRGTAAEWVAANPVLASGEAGVETDTFKFKIGDGSTAWNGLVYATTGSGGAGGGVDAETVRDIVGTTLVAGSGMTITPNDAGDTITLSSSGGIPTTRTIATTPPLTGGGDMSANRTLGVTVGTTAGTVAAGNHNHDDRYYTEAEADARFAPLASGGSTGAVTTADLPPGSVITMVQAVDGTWPQRRSSRTDLTGMWLRTVSGSSDPAAVTPPTLTGAYTNDIVMGA